MGMRCFARVNFKAKRRQVRLLLEEVLLDFVQLFLRLVLVGVRWRLACLDSQYFTDIGIETRLESGHPKHLQGLVLHVPLCDLFLVSFYLLLDLFLV